MNEKTDESIAEPPSKAQEEKSQRIKNPFERNLDVFIARVDSLGDHVGVAMAAIAQSHKQTQTRVDEFIKLKAAPVVGEEGAFTIPDDHYTEFRRLQRRLHRSRLALRSVPRGLTVALVSEFDAFMGATLKGFYRLKPDSLKATQRTMTFAELATFGSIKAAREFVLEKEVETFLRSSHSDQFETLESKLGISLRKDLVIWKDFIELTERRNLFVHTDGVVNSQYLQVCMAEGFDCSRTKRGERLEVPPEYFDKARDILYELAAKLSHVLWRKLSPDDIDRADAHFAGTLIFDLVYEERYGLARTLGDFGAESFKKWGSDYFRRALVVNRAQAYIWGGDREKGLQILNKEDWSAASDDFQVCIAALRRNFEDAIRCMKALGPNAGPRKEGFRDWPVFRELRNEKEFQAAFSEVFGESFATVTLESTSMAMAPEQIGCDVPSQEPIMREADDGDSAIDGDGNGRVR